MNRKGFTLVELIAVIGILLLIGLIAAPRVINVINNSRDKGYDEIERRLEEAAAKYIVNEYVDSNATSLKITKEELINSGYIKEIYDLKNNSVCDAYVFIQNLSSIADFNAVLNCESYSSQLEFVNLTVDLSDGTTSQKFQDVYVAGTTIKLEEPTKKNYGFVGWEIVNGDSVINENKLTIGTTDTTIRALYKEYFDLVIDLNGGKDNTKYKERYMPGTVIQLEYPTRENYNFLGWEIIEGSGTLSGSTFTTGNEKTVIRAMWGANSVLIRYDLNGGTYGTNSPISGTYGSTVEVSNPTKQGYTFTEWTVSGEGASISGTNLTVGSADVTLTANWQVNTYTISYNLNGGTSGSSAPTSGTYGSTVEISNPTKTGYTFTGWTVSDESLLSGTNLTVGSADVTLTANWEINTYTITYSLGGGTAGSSAPTSGTYGSTVTVSNPSKEGYAFTGWTVSGTGASISETNLTIGSGNITLTANWKQTIIYLYKNGEKYTDITGGWSSVKSSAGGSRGGSASASGSTIELYCYQQSSDSGNAHGISTNNKIDLTNVKKIYIKGSVSLSIAQYGEGSFNLKFDSSKGVTHNTGNITRSSGGSFELSLDVTKTSGSYYIIPYLYVRHKSSASASISEIYLELKE